MSNVTLEQKRVFALLAQEYHERVLQIVQRGTDAEVLINSTGDARALESFADKICALVLKDHPDYAGRDEDINADAALVANLVPRLVAEFNRTRQPN